MNKLNFKIPFFTAAALLLIILSFYFIRVKAVNGENTIAQKKAKYVFLFIGDGMGISQVQLTQATLPYFDNSVYDSDSLRLLQLPVTGFSTTHADNRYITGSAAAGTALATGNKTSISTISMSADHTKKLESIAKKAKKNDMRVGIITSVSIDHATPAVFYANSPSRDYYNYIAAQMAESDFDYFGGGYAKGNFEKYLKVDTTRHPADYTPTEIETLMEEKGYQITRNRAEFEAMKPGKNWTFSTYDESGAMSYAIDRKDSELTLADYTAKGIEMLDNENGFFMMVEGGKIDWASHANDAATVVYDVLDFDAAVNEALKFYKLHPEETLIIVTADHETGGLGLGFSGMGYKSDFALLTQQKISSALFSENAEKWIDDKIPFETIMDSVSFYYGLNDTSQYSTAKLSEEEYNRIRKAYEKSITGTDGTTQDYIIYGSYNPFTTLVTRILNEKAGIGWTSFSHTCTPVPVFAIGAGKNFFKGYYDNTDIPKRIMQVMEIE